MTEPIPEAPMADRVVELVRELRERIDALERVVAEYKAGRPIKPIPSYLASYAECSLCGGTGMVLRGLTQSGNTDIQFTSVTCPNCYGVGHA